MEEVSFPLFFLLLLFVARRRRRLIHVFPSSLHLPVSRHQLLDLPACLSGPPERNCGGSQECSIGCTGDSLSPTALLGICGGLRSPLSPCLLLYGDRGGCSVRVQREPGWRWCATKPNLVVLWNSCFSRVYFSDRLALCLAPQSHPLLCLSYVVTLSILCRRPFVVSFASLSSGAFVFPFLLVYT